MDTEERRRFAQQSHEYLIEQLQFNGATSTPSTATTEVTGSYRINFNHPVKELIWVYQDKNRCCPTVADITKNAWFNFGWNDHNLVYPGYLTDSATANVTGNNNLAANPFILDCVNGADMPLGTCGTPKMEEFTISYPIVTLIRFNLMVMTVLHQDQVIILDVYNLINTTQEFLKVKFTITVSVLDQKSINQVVHVIFQELIMLNCSIHCNL